ncbi:MAG: hypothetical protein JNM69_24545, partial [Archangium sp.]|nr:hypothetical protein [Archangium sp.]
SAVAGDTCATAIAMTPISSTQFTATGSLTSANDDSSGTCGGAGKDIAFTFVVAQASDVSFTITSIGGSSTPVGYLRRDDCTTELRCQSGTSASTPVNLQAGSYRLIVDALSATATGTFTATVTLSTPVPMVGDDCSGAEVLTLTSGSTTVSATTDGYMQNVTTTACTAAGPDRYYRLTLPTTTASLTATVTPSSGSRASVMLLGPTTIASCATASELTCGESPSSSAQGTLTATSLASGTYYLVVKNVGVGSGAFSMTVTTQTAGIAGDTCSTAVPLVFTGGAASASSTVSGAANDQSSTCATSSADVVYSFTATAGQVFSASVTPGSTWRPILTLMQGTACSSATQTACNASTTGGGSASIPSTTLTAGTYYLWVDSVSGAGAGTFTLSASLTGGTSTGGESCTAPTPLTFVGNSATVSGTTVGRVNDNTSSLVCTSVTGPDVVYSFTVTSGQSVTAVLTPSGSFRGALVLEGPSASCSTASEYDCLAGTASGATVNFSATSLAAGTYYLWVDGVSGASGTFSLSVTLSGGTVASGESCSDPIPLSFSLGTTGTASVSGSTTTAISDRTSASCGGSGPDRVYSFTVSGTRSFSVTLTPGSGFATPVLALTGPSATCSSASELVCTGGNLTFGPISRTLTSGTYYLWVDGFSSSSGTYSFTATLN